jgi:transposase
MTDKNINAQESQSKLAEKLNFITVRCLAIESMEEQIAEYVEDILQLYKDAGEKKTKGDIELLVKVYVDAKKAKQEEEAKIDKSKLRLNKMEELLEEISVLDQFRLPDLYDVADKLVGGV